MDCYFELVFFYKQKTAYELRISDWSTDVCSSDLEPLEGDHPHAEVVSPLDEPEIEEEVAFGAPAKFLRWGPEQAGKGAGGDPPDRLLRDAIARRQRDHSPVGLAVDQLGERLAVVRHPPAGDDLAILRCHQQLEGRLLRPLEGLADRRRQGAHPRIGDEIGRAQSELQSLMRISYAVFCLKKKHN